MVEETGGAMADTTEETCGALTVKVLLAVLGINTTGAEILFWTVAFRGHLVVDATLAFTGG